MALPPIDGGTPLDPDEAEGLIPGHIETRGELNEWEQANIAKAVAWLADRRARTTVLTLEFLRELHERMFDETWRWAGNFRTTGKSIGVPASQITESITNLLQDARFWIDQSTYSIDEIGVRFHHRLVSIHPYPNGNGRHARMLTDLLLEENGVARFTWGSSLTGSGKDPRTEYIMALRRADNGKFDRLLAFVRS